jgi:hypothetical protein
MMKSSSMTTSRVGCLLAFAALASIGGACDDDPVHDAQVAALGGEITGIPQGPYHRAGQPCTVCHGPEGPAATQFSMAGTVFDMPSDLVGVGNIQVLLVDAAGTSPPQGSVITNCVGNFYVTPDMWTPSFPVLAGLASGSMMATMTTQISRATSCAECHYDPPSTMSVGHLYLGVALNPDEEMACPVNPNLGSEFQQSPTP